MDGSHIVVDVRKAVTGGGPGVGGGDVGTGDAGLPPALRRHRTGHRPAGRQRVPERIGIVAAFVAEAIGERDRERIRQASIEQLERLRSVRGRGPSRTARLQVGLIEGFQERFAQVAFGDQINRPTTMFRLTTRSDHQPATPEKRTKGSAKTKNATA